MTTHIKSTSANPLHHLLQIFDAQSLGEGDLVAGANVLAAECISLANLYPPGACLITDEGECLAVGMSFAAVGGLTNSLVNERVLEPIGRIQNNLGDHLAADAAHSATKLAAMPPQERLRNRPPPPENPSSLTRVHYALTGIALARDSAAFRLLLEPCRDQGPGELTATPAVFLDADSPAGLEKQLAQAHRRHPYVRAVLADGPGTERLESLLLSVVRGTSLPAGVTGPVHIRGHLAVSCTAAKLARSVGAGDANLLGNLLWILDGDGSALTSQQEEVNPPAYATHLNFTEALRTAWAHRLDYRQPAPPTIRCDWTQRHREWIGFLQKLEAKCPGLTSAARPLFGTLVFGLVKLTPDQKGEPQRWNAAGVLGLAKFLVGRMVQCREQLVQTERDVRVMELALKVVPKLEAGPLDAREITCKMHRLRIGDCRDVLELLNRLGVARGVADGRWELVLSTAQAVKKIRNPHYLDV